jgi:quercetin dioxygenase-like cupin family protein
MAVEATFMPGKSHDFHRHPNQEEVIYVLEGQVEQWVEREHRLLGPGDAVVIPTAVVHASFNIGDEPA